ncbi:MAG: 6-bladed beta-propeller [Candidatus Delongbacteria bacterium]|nr:6-bladed beta-propeller [Candidatus Delongbacteria bacterium]
MKNTLILVSIIILLISCSKKEEVQKLKTVKLTKLYTIEGFPEGADSTRTFSFTWNGTKVDTEGNVFVRDDKSGSIRVFDRNGKFENNITNTGMGPEEIERSNVYYFDRDTVCIIDNMIKLKKFLKNGKYISTKIIEHEEITLPQEIYELNDSILVVRMTTYKRAENNLILGQSLSIVDKDLNTKKVIYEAFVDYPKEGDQILFKEPIFTYNDSSIFLTKRNKSEYKVDVYSHTGKFKGNIRKKYVKKRFTAEELDLMFKDGNKPKDADKIYDYKLAMYDIMADKNGYLWTLIEGGFSSKDMVFDIFNNDKLIANFVLENPTKEKHEKVIYLKDKFYLIDYENDIIEVYDYEFE